MNKLLTDSVKSYSKAMFSGQCQKVKCDHFKNSVQKYTTTTTDSYKYKQH